ncbi:MAG TPA: DUF5682 family protein, partial [Chloroflexota bacterium]|nr:DUF5682 family protein [Chloroflexota bacterium]
MAILICPVRHHSPAAALQVARLIRERRPRAVLVEGPADGTDLIPLLLDGETAPPVALYAYRATPEGTGGGPGGTDGEGVSGGPEVRAVYYPFCEYSPEYVALKAGQEVGAELRFCDVPAATTLARPPAPRGEDPLPPTALPGFGDFAAAVAGAAGYGSFEEFWEAVFEQAAGAAPPETALAWLETFGRQARQLAAPGLDVEHGVRERHMAGAALALVEQGLASESILLVCGAAHAGPIAEAFAGGGGPGPLPHPAPAATPAGAGEETRLALIPYSYPRLSEQLGYGAGNRAPWYYQEVWRRRGDFGVATQRALLALAARLRQEGQSASLAQCIDAYNLACVLAGMRRKGAPGADELREAAVSCFGQGQPAPVAAAVTHVLIGDAVGRITPRVGRTPLQVEFYATAQRLRLPLQDVPRQVLLHLVAPREAEGSVFLHRLALAGVPFARPLQSGLGRPAPPTGAASPGSAPIPAVPGAGQPLQQLGLVREKWELQWTPATDARLIERTAWGSRLADVCVRLLGGQLAGAGRIDAGTTVLLQAALCDVLEGLPGAIERCEALAADSASFPPLARATYHLDGLLTYGAARRLPSARLGALAARLFARAALHLPEAAACGDEDAAQIQAALIPLHDLVRRGSPAAGSAPVFWSAVEVVAERP